MKPISEREILAAQKEWGDGIVEIGRLMLEGGDYTARAEQHIDTLYAYDLAPTLFNPTKAAEVQFRTKRAGALSYFVAGNADYEEDHGFALQPWTAVRFENAGFFIAEGLSLAMGNYFFTDTDDVETKVEYTFGYIRDDAGRLRIVLHHSSLPYSG